MHGLCKVGLAKMLLGGGKNLNEANKFEAFYGADKFVIAEILLGGGAGPNKADKIGRTPLHWVALIGHKEISQVLINGAADPNKMDND